MEIYLCYLHAPLSALSLVISETKMTCWLRSAVQSCTVLHPAKNKIYLLGGRDLLRPRNPFLDFFWQFSLWQQRRYVFQKSISSADFVRSEPIFPLPIRSAKKKKEESMLNPWRHRWWIDEEPCSFFFVLLHFAHGRKLASVSGFNFKFSEMLILILWSIPRVSDIQPYPPRILIFALLTILIHFLSV